MGFWVVASFGCFPTSQVLELYLFLKWYVSNIVYVSLRGYTWPLWVSNQLPSILEIDSSGVQDEFPYQDCIQDYHLSIQKQKWVPIRLHLLIFESMLVLVLIQMEIFWIPIYQMKKQKHFLSLDFSDKTMW